MGNYNTGKPCKGCGRPTTLSVGLCPSCCSDKYTDTKYQKLPEINNDSNTLENKLYHVRAKDGET